ncbi:hypothetical protein VTN77DRAFT_4210 [Rasamsonia byssochlamydoides]|uniref:uncharacterized protein n=1 Tax=Rasamsonia byssochlamydoides TaxID=89139 RepID=UPI003742A354
MAIKGCPSVGFVRLSPSAGDMASSGGAVIGLSGSTGRQERAADDDRQTLISRPRVRWMLFHSILILRRSNPTGPR